MPPSTSVRQVGACEAELVAHLSSKQATCGNGMNYLTVATATASTNLVWGRVGATELNPLNSVRILETSTALLRCSTSDLL